MKKIMLTAMVVLMVFVLSACAVNNTENSIDTDNGDTVNTSSDVKDTETGENGIGSEANVGENTAETIVSPNEEETNTSEPAIGGDILCEVHNEYYHVIPGALINYVGTTEYEEWRDEVSSVAVDSNAECRNMMTIKDFIDAFDIPREVYEEKCDRLSYCVVDPELLYNGTVEEVEAYFSDLETLAIVESQRAHYSRVWVYIRQAYEDVLEPLEAERGKAYMCIPELVELLDIDRVELEGYIKNATEDFDRDFTVYATFDYNLDMIYGPDTIQSGTITLEPQTNILSVNHDDDPTNDISTNELDEMFCRIGRYAE